MSNAAFDDGKSPINHATSLTDVSPIVYAAAGAVPTQNPQPAAQPAEPAAEQAAPQAQSTPAPAEPTVQPTAAQHQAAQAAAQPPAPQPANTPPQQAPTPAAAQKKPQQKIRMQAAAPRQAQPQQAQSPAPQTPVFKTPASQTPASQTPASQTPEPHTPEPHTPVFKTPASPAPQPRAAQPAAPQAAAPQQATPPGLNPASVVGSGAPTAVGAVAAAKLAAKTAAPVAPLAAPTVPPDNSDGVGGIQRQMLQLVSTAESKQELLDNLARSINSSLPNLQLVYCPRDVEGNLDKVSKIGQAQEIGSRRLEANDCATACKLACRTGKLITQSLPNSTAMIIAAPIPLRGSDPEAVGIVFPNTESARVIMMLSQMVVSQIVLWHVLGDSRQSDTEARDSGALVELLGQLSEADSVRHACYALAAELESFLDCQRVAIGLRTGDQGSCQLVAISGVAHFDKRSQMVQSYESSMDEAIFRNTVVRWPPSDDAQRLPALAHKRLCTLEDAKGTVSTPLHDRDGEALGAIIVLSSKTDSLSMAARFLELAESSLAAAIAAVRRHEGGSMLKAARASADVWKSWKGKLAAGVVVAVGASMMIPIPYTISCDCQIEPVTRRYIAAPFEGTLEKSLVRPGDVVEQGALLARMDGREIRWKRAGADADLKQAIKKRDAAQASHNYADQQIARLEAERLKLELELLDHRAENLEIKSPIAGIVASGDLERAQGAPLSTGQTMFEIAPLEKMIVEVALPDDEISHIGVDQGIDVRLDAYPGQSWRLLLQKIQPRSETRDRDNVFIAEAELDNTDGRLRPGMKGRAKVRTPSRRLGWILFHKPWEYVSKKILW